MKQKEVTVVIPAYNEEKTIGKVVKATLKYADEVLVVNDGSNDKTVDISKEAGAKVISHKSNMGYVKALKTGFKNARGNIIVTIDADGQHNPEDIPRLLKPILKGEADVAIGARETMTFSEKVITRLTGFKVKASDASSGFKALRRKLALKLELRGKCVCGTFVLEAAKLGARIEEVKVKTGEKRFGKSRARKRHFVQTLIVIKELLS